MAVLTRDDARRHYLVALATERPEVLTELEAIVETTAPQLPVGYLSEGSAIGETDHNMSALIADTLAGKNPSLAHVGERGREALAWFLRWRLLDPWAIRWAEQTAREWDDRIGRRGEWTARVFVFREVHPIVLKVAVNDWQPNLETWEAWQAATLRAARREIVRYRKRRLEELGEGRTPMRKIPEHHYLWLVRYHNFGWTYAEIARAHEPVVDEATVRLALPRAAELIGLTLERAARGRPKREKTEALTRTS